jgi:phage/plasmid-like protein (TIGR03299 family)
MAHEVEQMFSVKETPWHGLGRIIREAPTMEEGIRLAGLDWRIDQRPVFTSNSEGGLQAILDKTALVRSDTDVTMAVLGNKYKPLQNSEAFQFFQPFLDEKMASLETAGSLKDGRKIWVLAKLNKAPIEITRNDIVEKYLLLSNSHDGTLAVRVGFTPIRVVCANTMAYAHESNASSLIRVYHGKNVKQNVDALRETINIVDATFEASEEKMKFLARQNLNKEDLRKYIKTVMSIAEKYESERQQINADRMEARIMELFEVSAGAKEAGDTYWGAYNAVNYYLNYEVGRSQEGRLNNLWFGGVARKNQFAFDTAVRMAG